MKTDNAFRLSRIQAEGWNAARRVSSTAAAGLDSAKIEALNPYSTDAERLRWTIGFKSMLDGPAH